MTDTRQQDLQARSPGTFSPLATGAGHRLLAAAVLVAGLWLAVAWALH